MTVKFSGLPPAITMEESNIFALVQSGTTRQIAASAYADWILGSYNGYQNLGNGALTGNIIEALQLFVHTSQYSTSGDFDTALAALTGTFGVGNLEVGENLTVDGDVSLVDLSLTGDLDLASASTLGWNADTKLVRDAANTLAMRNGITRQTLRIYSSFTDASNYERLNFLFTGGNAFRIETVSAGTGSARNLELNADGLAQLYFFTGGTSRWQVNASGHFFGSTDNTYDIGASGALRPRNLYLGSNAAVGGNLTVAGNTTIGDSSADTLTINAGTWTLGSNFTAARAAGVLGSGTQTIQSWLSTYTGAADGTTAARGFLFSATGSGGNAVVEQRGTYMATSWAGTAALTALYGAVSITQITSTGNVTSANAFRANVAISGAGSVTTADNYIATAPVLTGTGAITTLYGFRAANIADALVGAAVGFKVDDFAGSTTMRGIQSSLSSGTGKHNLYIDGTAPNYFAGQLLAGDGSAAAPSYAFNNDTNTGLFRDATTANLIFANNGNQPAAVSSAGLMLNSASLLSWGGNFTSATSGDLLLARDAANTLAQRNGTSVQTFRLYGTYTDASNYERLTLSFPSNVFTISADAAGTGTTRALRIQTGGAAALQLGTNNTVYWNFSGAGGHMLATTDNSTDIGASGATRPRTGYFGTSVVTPTLTSGGTENLALSTSGGAQARILHIASAVNYVALNGNVSGASAGIGALGNDTDVGLNIWTKGAGAFLFRTGANATSQFQITHSDSSVNYLRATGAATTSAPVLSAQGTDTNIDITLTPKGTGKVKIGTEEVATKTGTNAPTQSIIVAASDETTALTTGTAKVTFRMPYAFTLTAVRASLTTAQGSGSIFTVDINENGTSILSTKLTIDNGEKTSVTAATPPVISDSSLADDSSITVDIDQVGNGTAAGLKITLIGRQTS